MPASSFDFYHMQDARNNFDAMRPAPICTDGNQKMMAHCPKIHISTNFYYGYHNLKRSENLQIPSDCEMLEVHSSNEITSPQSNSRKRSAEDAEYPQTKRVREEGMVPSTSNYNPCLLRPTHNNPDISRCLMVHMI